MKGCRPFSPAEIEALTAYMAQCRHSVRDRTLLHLGLRTGFRISELLSLRVKDVLQNGKVVSRIRVARRFMKGKKESRELALHPAARAALEELVGSLPADPETFLFRAQGGNKPLNRRTAWVVLKKASKACGMDGKVATHSMRKTFAKRCYDLANGDIRKVQEAMGHRNLNSTAAYIGVTQDEVDDLILKS